MFKYRREIHFYETDLMKIVHHANYLRFAEETRVAWAFHEKVLARTRPEEAASLAVLSTAVSHISPLRFGDTFEVEMQAKRDGIRIVFEYKIWNLGDASLPPKLSAEVRSTHVAINAQGRPEKPTPNLKAVMEKETWTATWLSNL
ncbi:MAG: acyl-CoA thioesterase [Bdellovibrionaceae bacterium]|nr:acyl-CoA thioesterase [Pseudobdellovibrionaceae bacterium]